MTTSKGRKDIAVELAKEHKAVSVAEFFERNRHLLGFDSKPKALLTAVKEAVENGLDAVEEMAYRLVKKGSKPVLPEIIVRIEKLGEDMYKVSVEDNGPGIVKEICPYIFGKFLYGSKFHKLKQRRGQQGIGISAVTLYSQLTTGKPMRVVSKTASMDNPYYMEIMIDVSKNEPIIVEEGELSIKDFPKDHGTRVEFTLVGRYIGRGDKSIYEYLRRTAIANPHATIVFYDPNGNKYVFERITNELPPEPKEIKPHPYGIELGILQRMILKTTATTLLRFLIEEFSGVGKKSAEEILKKAGLDPNRDPKSLSLDEIKVLLKAMQSVKLRSPPTNCLSPIGAKNLEEAVKKWFNPEFVAAVTRKPKVYRGLPFLVEVALGYGGSISGFKLIRYANKVPLLYDQGACAITEAVKEVNWKNYALNTDKHGFPDAPVVLIVHVASVWIPFTSESKYAIAHYEEIIDEIKLACQEVARKLRYYIQRKKALELKMKKRTILLAYARLVAKHLEKATGAPQAEIFEKLKKIVDEKLRLEEMALSIK